MDRWKSVSTNFATLCGQLSNTVALLVINGVLARSMTLDQFGFWSMLYYINLFTNGLDMGFQLTLGNRLAALGSRGAEAEEERRETFITIILLEALFFVADSVIVLLVAPHLPWTRWFKVSDPLLGAQVVHFMPIVLVVMIGTLPLGLMWTVYFAYGEIKLASGLSAGSNALQVVIVVVAAWVCKFKFTWVILIYFLCVIAVDIILTLYAFIRRGWKFSVPPVARMAAIVRSLARVSFHAFLLTISAIISRILAPLASGVTSGLAVAGDFSLIQRLFSFLGTSHLAIMAPVGPAVAREGHAGNWGAVRKLLRVYVFQVWPAYFGIIGAGVWCAHPVLIRLWAGHWYRDYTLAALLLVGACLGGFINTFSVFLNSLGLVKVQGALSFIMLIPSVVLMVIFSRWLGLSGIALASAVCSLPAAILWPFYTRDALRQKKLRV